ncbi:MAG: alginate export family protein [Pseudomonadota bacterium]
MMKCGIFAIFLAIHCVIAAKANADDTFFSPTLKTEALGLNWGASFNHRTRLEATGEIGPPGRSQIAALMRTGFHVHVGRGAAYLGGELLDARYYNLTSADFGRVPVDEAANAVEPVQFYVGAQFDDIFGRGVSLNARAGRLTLDIGSGRLIGRRRFRNTVQTFMGGELLARHGDLQMRAFGVRPVRANCGSFTNGIEVDRLLDLRGYNFGVHLQKNRLAFIDATVELYLFGERLNFPASGLRSFLSFTPGLRLSRPSKLGAFDFDFEAATNFAEVELDVLFQSPIPPGDVFFFREAFGTFGYFFHAEAGRTFDAPFSPRLGLVFDIGSGPGNDFLTRFRVTQSDFDLSRRQPAAFGSRARLYDDFGPASASAIYAPFRIRGSSFGIDGSNIISPGAVFSADAFGKISIKSSYRYFWREDALIFDEFETPQDFSKLSRKEQMTTLVIKWT